MGTQLGVYLAFFWTIGCFEISKAYEGILAMDQAVDDSQMPKFFTNNELMPFPNLIRIKRGKSIPEVDDLNPSSAHLYPRAKRFFFVGGGGSQNKRPVVQQKCRSSYDECADGSCAINGSCRHAIGKGKKPMGNQQQCKSFYDECADGSCAINGSCRHAIGKGKGRK